MFFDDIALCRYAAEKYGPIMRPVVDVGGLEDPTIADYQKTIDEMAKLPRPIDRITYPSEWPLLEKQHKDDVRAAQFARYLNIHRPLSFLADDYVCENPEMGGCDINYLFQKYPYPNGIGTAVLLSVLEHVERPWDAIYNLADAMDSGGLIIVSVPWIFPWHGSPQDHFRYSPTGLRQLFGKSQWDILEADWRLKISADAGVLDINTGKPQAIESCFLIARAR